MRGKADHCNTDEIFREYKESLELAREEGPKTRYGMLNWTVQQHTPDTLYYQSFTHEVYNNF